MWKRLIEPPLWVVFLFLIPAVAGGNDLKWGKVSKAEIKLTQCEFEPGANAVVLNDEGVLKIESNRVVITRHRRIKILNENGFDQGNIEIPFYTKENWEVIKSVKAQTINVNDQGDVEKIKIPNDKIYEVDKSGDWKAVRFTFPALKIGSIVEYSYVTLSKSYTFLDGWMFQSEIPTLQSSFSALIPESMDYRILFEGKGLMQKYGGSEPVNRWSLKNIFSIREEPFVANYLDYAEKIRFQLAGYKKMGTPRQGVEYVTIMTTWEKLAKERLQDPNYSTFLNKGGKAKDILGGIDLQGLNSQEKIEAIYNYVKNNYRWNGKSRLFTNKNFNEFENTKSGNNAEINLFLTLLLKNAGLDANPVLLSTRKHGKITRSYPFLTQFNYLICNVNLDGKDILMDATNPHRPYSFLSRRCLNEYAYLLDSKSPRWIKIKPNANTYETAFIEAAFDREGNVTYNVNIKYNGYQAMALRDKLNEEQYLSFLEEILEIEDLDLALKNVEYKHKNQLKKPFELSFTLDQKNVNQNDLIYFQPVLINNQPENPFKSELRYFPVDYSYPFKENYIIAVEIPDNFQIVELPANARVALPDKLGSFIYASQVQGNKYQLSVSFRINEATIPSHHYEGLQEFYNIMVAKLTEMVVIKKIK